MTAQLPFPECVRRRPGMYIGDTESSDGVSHFAFEIIGNAIDEHLRGFADCIDVVVDEQHIEVTDNGRGIDVLTGGSDVFTSLHFTPTRDGHTPHIHAAPGRGIGLAVICALSDLVVVDVARAGRSRRHTYARGAVLDAPEELGPSRTTGTRISAAPDRSIFSVPLNASLIEQRLRELAYLTPGANFSMNGRTIPRGPLDAYCLELAGEDELVAPPLHVRCTIDEIVVDVACAWRVDAKAPALLSFVSTQRTQDDSTHVRGFFEGLKAAFGDVGSSVRASTFRQRASRGLVAVVHVGLFAPRFGDPTRARLANPEAKRAVRSALLTAFPGYLVEHPSLRRALRDRISARVGKS